LGDSTPQARVPESDADVRDRFVVIAQHYCTLAKAEERSAEQAATRRASTDGLLDSRHRPRQVKKCRSQRSLPKNGLLQPSAFSPDGTTMFPSSRLRSFDDVG